MRPTRRIVKVHIGDEHPRQGVHGVGDKGPVVEAIRWDVFIPCFFVIGGAALLGIVNNKWLTDVTYEY
mgnify:CR=1 FL=1